MSADAELLRQAASRVREVGSKATKGVCPHWTWSAVRHIARNVDLDCPKHDTADEIDPDCESWARYDDSPWFSLVDARLAEPLALWLDFAAGVAEKNQQRSQGDAMALSVARVLVDAELPR